MTRALNCGICGATFECMGPLSFGCWCAKVNLTEEKRTELKCEARDCVCPICLAR
ncbi:MAG: cysteine-rich CWC family protein [Nitrososphaerales archaeon]